MFTTVNDFSLLIFFLLGDMSSIPLLYVLSRLLDFLSIKLFLNCIFFFLGDVFVGEGNDSILLFFLGDNELHLFLYFFGLKALLLS